MNPAAFEDALDILHEQDSPAALLNKAVARFDEAVKLGLPGLMGGSKERAEAA